MKAAEVKKAVRRDWSDGHSTFFEVKGGSTFLGDCPRMDVVGIEHSWSPPTVKIAEVKVSRRDFLNDTKWRTYLDYCNEFYWAVPTGLVGRDEIDAKAGLIMVNPNTGSVTTVKAAPHLDIEEDKGFKMLYYLLTWRHNNERLGREARMQRIEEELQRRKDLGERYTHFVSERLQEAADRVRAAEASRDHAQRMQEMEKEKVERKLESINEAEELIEAARGAVGRIEPDQLKTLLEKVPYSLENNLKRIINQCSDLRDFLFGGDNGSDSF